MNFLSHYYIHKSQNIYYNAGLVMPDLFRNDLKLIRKIKPVFGRIEHQQLYNGCLRHIEDDKIFHASEFFNNGYRLFSDIINQLKFSDSVKRKWFLSHVFFEMYVDRMLVTHLPGLAESFYENLLTIDASMLKSFLAMFECKNIEAGYQNFLKFLDLKFIQNYPDNKQFALSLGRLMKRAGAGEFSEFDLYRIEACLNQLDNLILKDKLSLLYLLHNIFA